MLEIKIIDGPPLNIFSLLKKLFLAVITRATLDDW